MYTVARVALNHELSSAREKDVSHRTPAPSPGVTLAMTGVKLKAIARLRARAKGEMSGKGGGV